MWCSGGPCGSQWWAVWAAAGVERRFGTGNWRSGMALGTGIVKLLLGLGNLVFFVGLLPVPSCLQSGRTGRKVLGGTLLGKP